MPFLYGNHVVKAHLGRITEDTPEHQGVVVFSMSDVPLVPTHLPQLPPTLADAFIMSGIRSDCTIYGRYTQTRSNSDHSFSSGGCWGISERRSTYYPVTIKARLVDDDSPIRQRSSKALLISCSFLQVYFLVTILSLLHFAVARDITIRDIPHLTKYSFVYLVF